MPDEPPTIDPAAAMAAVRARVRRDLVPADLAGGADATALPDFPALLSLATLTADREIRTHRRGFGWYVKLRRWLHREVRLTVDPPLTRQTALNRALVAIVARQAAQIAQLQSHFPAPTTTTDSPHPLDPWANPELRTQHSELLPPPPPNPEPRTPTPAS